MSLEYEEEFVEKFITKNKRERLLFELSSTKKRKHAILIKTEQEQGAAVNYILYSKN